MATEKQRRANRANAQKSTGPASPEGKARASRNRLSHGYTASLYFAPGQDSSDFYENLANYLNHYQPVGPFEQALVEQIARHQWNYQRANYDLGSIHNQLVQKDVREVFALLLRYQTAAERGFQRCSSDLLKLQKEREKSENGFVSQSVCTAADLQPEPALAPVPETEAEPEIAPEPASKPVAHPQNPPAARVFRPEVFDVHQMIAQMNAEAEEQLANYRERRRKSA